MAEEERTTCFRCKVETSSPSALEVHLRSCTTEWVPTHPAPWTFIPPPDSYGRPGDRGRGRGRTRGGRRERTTGDTVRRGRSGGRSSGRQMGDDAGQRGRGGWRGREGTRGGYRSRHNRGGRRSSVGSDNQDQPDSELSSSLIETVETLPKSKPESYHMGNSNMTGPKCTKCQLSFDNPRDLAKHFDESPAHPNLASSPAKRSGPPAPDSDNSPLSPSSDWYATYAAPRTRGPAQCTKCNLSFDNPQELATHFYESPAHPFSVPPVGNRWMAPAFEVAPWLEGMPTVPGELRGGRSVVPRYRDAVHDGEIDDEMIDELVGVRFRKLGLH